MSDTAESGLRTIRYADGTDEVLVAVPWGTHTGLIPPPTITFGHRQFVYSGDGPRVTPPGECSCAFLGEHRVSSRGCALGDDSE